MRVMSYPDALEESIPLRRHLLLGNGFSIAASDRFRYASLFEEAFDEDDARPRQIFEQIGTTDFEWVLSRLDIASTVLGCYPGSEAIATAVAGDRQLIARRLVDALARIHPGRSLDIPDADFAASRTFLSEMRRADRPELCGLIFTTNYDLLLYWSTLRNGEALQTRDGFSRQGQELLWSEDKCQSVFHLHGALHMFARADGSVAKLSWAEDQPLIDQVVGLIERNFLPLFVTEGTSAQKVERIGASSYLRDALSRFEVACSDDNAALFVYGSALADDHIVGMIPQGRLTRVCVSALNVAEDRPQLAALEANWRERRELAGLPDVEVVVFPALEAAPWGQIVVAG